MGMFCTNVQLRRGPDTSLEMIAKVLDAFVAERGMVRGDPDANAYDRTIVVRAGEGDWISIYDEDTEDQRVTNLYELAAVLSRLTHSTAVSILVHDSSVVLLGLFVEGEMVDEYNSDPRHMDGSLPPEMAATEEQVAAAAGQAARWKHILVPGATPEQLERVWREDTWMAERQLARVAELLGCSMDRVCVGLNYFEFDEVPSTELLILPYVVADEGDEAETSHVIN